MSVKLQSTLPDDLAVELKSSAARLEIPVTQWIRETMEAKLQELKAEKNSDPFASITGIIDSQETDLAARVDEILYR
jgi:hypothetical protein